ncbi:hypothetical protein F3K36_20465 [Delftia sp. BR1]|nr:hypothetical protein F3K36_20465 [Delftia sp. BR1]
MMLKVLAIAVIATLSLRVSAQDCGPTPYSVALKQAKGQITVTVPEGLQSISPGDARLTADFVRRMFSATAPAVLDEVLSAYDCHVTKAIDKSKPSEERRAALLDAWSEVKAQMNEAAVRFADAWNKSMDAGLAASPVNDKKDLTADEKALASFVQKIPTDNFLVATSGGLYATAIYKGLPINACAGFVRSALMDNEAGIQHYAAALRPALVAYVSSVRNGSRDAKMKLWTQARNVQATQYSSSKTSTEMEICKSTVPTPVSPAMPASEAASAATLAGKQ